MPNPVSIPAAGILPTTKGAPPTFLRAQLLTLYKIRNALPATITPRYNIQIKASAVHYRCWGDTYAFVANKRTELCSQRRSVISSTLLGSW